MLRRILRWGALAVALTFAVAYLRSTPWLPAPSAQAANARFPSYNSAFGPPRGYKGPVFELSQDYPKELPHDDDLPWKKYNFQTQARDYLLAMQEYAYAGNINRGKDPDGYSLDWIVQKNPVRHWYHMPWRDYGDRGREFMHGMSMEFPALPGSLNREQKGTYSTYAVAMYNDIAAYTIGQVWPDASRRPNTQGVVFHDGALVTKLLFTTAVESDVPEIHGAYQWDGYIYQDATCLKQGCPRAIEPVRLVQMDIAVKDSRGSKTGWVFGTFVYKHNENGSSVWQKMVPLGLMWGVDPELTSADPQGKPQESAIFEVGLYQHLGCHGRLTGPVDNPTSACESCHMTAQYPSAYSLPNKLYACDESPQNSSYWQNLQGGSLFQQQGNGPTNALDYSMEMASAVQNYYMDTEHAIVAPDDKTYTFKGSNVVYNVVRRQE
jgi:hypothetical protein